MGCMSSSECVQKTHSSGGGRGDLGQGRAVVLSKSREDGIRKEEAEQKIATKWSTENVSYHDSKQVITAMEIALGAQGARPLIASIADAEGVVIEPPSIENGTTMGKNFAAKIIEQSCHRRRVTMVLRETMSSSSTSSSSATDVGASTATMTSPVVESIRQQSHPDAVTATHAPTPSPSEMSMVGRHRLLASTSSVQKAQPADHVKEVGMHIMTAIRDKCASRGAHLATFESKTAKDIELSPTRVRSVDIVLTQHPAIVVGRQLKDYVACGRAEFRLVGSYVIDVMLQPHFAEIKSVWFETCRATGGIAVRVTPICNATACVLTCVWNANQNDGL